MMAGEPPRWDIAFHITTAIHIVRIMLKHSWRVFNTTMSAILKRSTPLAGALLLRERIWKQSRCLVTMGFKRLAPSTLISDETAG